jgi:hypothetical protein
LSSGGRAQRRRCRPLSSTSCWRSRPRLQGRPRLYSLGGRFYPRIPRLYGLHPVGSGRLVFADPDPHSSRLSIWVAEAASTSSGGLSQVAAVLAVLYSLASRLGLLLRQIRIQCYGSASKNCRILLGPPRSSGLGGRRSSSRYLAMASPVLYCLGGSRIRASTADPGVVSSAVPSVPVESGTLHTATLPHFYRPRHAPAASEAASTKAFDYSVLASPLPAWFLHQEGPRRPASSRTRRFYFTPGEFLFRSGQIF